MNSDPACDFTSQRSALYPQVEGARGIFGVTGVRQPYLRLSLSGNAAPSVPHGKRWFELQRFYDVSCVVNPSIRLSLVSRLFLPRIFLGTASG
jgi:hypothetical protein